MPTPTHTFLAVAAHYGNVDPNDPEAVHEWFTEVLPTLPHETIEEILEVLLVADGSSTDKDTVRSYPHGVPLPSLSGSPAAQIPLLAARWRELLNQLTARRKKI